MTDHRFVICTDNKGYEVSLERRKLYEILPDTHASTLGQVRVIDESGEDYLYPESYFTHVDLPQETARQVLHAA